MGLNLFKIFITFLILVNYQSDAHQRFRAQTPRAQLVPMRELVKNGAVVVDFQNVASLLSPTLAPKPSPSTPQMKIVKSRSLETESEEEIPAVDSNDEPDLKLRQGAIDPAIPPAELLGLIPLAVLSVQAPILYVLFAFIIANLSLVGVGRGEMTRNIANAEAVLGNINAFTAARGEVRTPFTSAANSTKAGKNKKKRVKESILVENVLSQKQGLLSDFNSLDGVSRPVLVVAILLVAYGILRVGIFPGLLSGILTYLFYSNYLGHRKKNSRRGQRVKRSTSSLYNSPLEYPSGETIVRLIHSYNPSQSYKQF